MFSFHRPKVYRSPTGCCICKAKSSSSRFTDSKKYEDDFIECFKLIEPRQGEICNACVLLVKRYKKLPIGSDRNWKHVVDARAGPGMKSMSKFKSKNKNKKTEGGDHHHRLQLVSKKKMMLLPELAATPMDWRAHVVDDAEMGDDDDLLMMESGSHLDLSRTPSPGDSDCEDSSNISMAKGRRKPLRPLKRIMVAEEPPRMSDYIDPTYWKRESVCCGVIFRGRFHEVMVDVALWNPCPARLAAQQCELSKQQSKVPDAKPEAVIKLDDAKIAPDSPESATGKVFSDSGSDSGYDESSNQGQGLVETISSAFKKERDPAKAVSIEEEADTLKGQILTSAN